MENQPKNGFGQNFWLNGPIDLRIAHLNYILQDLIKDTPLDHILVPKHAYLAKYAYLGE